MLISSLTSCKLVPGSPVHPPVLQDELRIPEQARGLSDIANGPRPRSHTDQVASLLLQLRVSSLLSRVQLILGLILSLSDISALMQKGEDSDEELMPSSSSSSTLSSHDEQDGVTPVSEVTPFSRENVHARSAGCAQPKAFRNYWASVELTLTFLGQVVHDPKSILEAIDSNVSVSAPDEHEVYEGTSRPYDIAYRSFVRIIHVRVEHLLCGYLPLGGVRGFR